MTPSWVGLGGCTKGSGSAGLIDQGQFYEVQQVHVVDAVPKSQ